MKKTLGEILLFTMILLGGTLYKIMKTLHSLKQ